MSLGLGARRATAQAMLADDIIILSKGQRAKEKAKAETHLGGTPSIGESPFGFSPGTGAARLGERPGPAVSSAIGLSRPAGILSAASGYETGAARLHGPSRITSPTPMPSREAPTFGALEVPGGEDEGPPGGLTLDLAIDRLVHANPDLGTKFQEILKAEAETLTAGLRANPLVFASADSVPYGSYSPGRPGNNAYTVVLIQPIDVNQKRQVRVLVAQQARKVLEAQYQNASGWRSTTCTRPSSTSWTHGRRSATSGRAWRGSATS